MAQTIDMEAIRKLSTTERLALIEQIIETLAEDAPVPTEVLDEMDRRLAEYDADPSIGVSHDEMMKRLRKLT